MHSPAAHASRSDATPQQIAQLAHSVDAFLTQDVIDARLGPHVGGHAPQLAEPLTQRPHHAGQFLRPHHDQRDETNYCDLQKRNAEHGGKLASASE